MNYDENFMAIAQTPALHRVMLMYNCYLSHFKNIVELHSILLALTCSCTLILASSNIEFIADCQ